MPFCRKWLAAAGLAAAAVSAEAFAAPAPLGVRRDSVLARSSQRGIARVPTLRVRGGSGLGMTAAAPAEASRFPDSADTTTRLTPANAGACRCWDRSPARGSAAQRMRPGPPQEPALSVTAYLRPWPSAVCGHGGGHASPLPRLARLYSRDLPCSRPRALDAHAS